MTDNVDSSAIVEFLNKPAPGRERSRVVYTALMGSYEKVVERAAADTSVLPHLCFTDNPSLESATWTVILVEPRFAGDSIRSARFLKTEGHPLLDQYDESMWVDNRVQLLITPDELFDKFLATADVSLPLHSRTESVAKEFRAVLHSRLDDPWRLREQFLAYQEAMPEVLSAQPYWTAIILRKRNERVDRVFALWMDHIARYSRRDQLSVNFILGASGLVIRPIVVNNDSSVWHRWVPLDEMDRNRRTSRWLPSSQYSLRTRIGDYLDRSFVGRRATWALAKVGLYARFVPEGR